MYPFERFNVATKRVLTLAQEEAERAHVNYIGTEHLLLGLLSEPNTVAGEVLRGLNVDLVNARGIIGTVMKPEADERIIIQHIIPTSRVKKVIEISFEEAREMGDGFVGTEHLLLALLVEGEGIAAHVLEDLGVTLETVRTRIASVRKTGTIVESSKGAESSGYQAFAGRGSAARPLSGLRLVLFERAGEKTTDGAPVYVNPVDVVRVDRVSDDETSITLRHNDSSALVVRGPVSEVARRLTEQ
jgi:ATP-dependent Clp protease ATP-binding subunit ClpA